MANACLIQAKCACCPRDRISALTQYIQHKTEKFAPKREQINQIKAMRRALVQEALAGCSYYRHCVGCHLCCEGQCILYEPKYAALHAIEEDLFRAQTRLEAQLQVMVRAVEAQVEHAKRVIHLVKRPPLPLEVERG